MDRMKLKQHPLSAAWPAMTENEWAEFLADVREHGIQQPILLYDGQVLDGWHRYRASQELGLSCRMEVLDDGDPVALVISRNAARRHITWEDRHLAIMRCRGLKEPGRPKKGAIMAPFSKSANSNEIENPEPDDGKGVTLDEVVQEAGGGSRRTALRAARRYREEQAPAPTIPEQTEPEPEPKRRGTASMAERLELCNQKLAVVRRQQRDRDDLIFDLQSKLKTVAEDASPELSGRLQELNNHIEMNRVLKGQVVEWQTKYEEVRKENADLRRWNTRLRKQVQENGTAST